MNNENQILNEYDNDPFSIDDNELEVDQTDELVNEANIFQDLPDTDDTNDNNIFSSGNNEDDINPKNEEENIDKVNQEDEDLQNNNKNKDPLDALFGDDDVNQDDLGEDENKNEIEKHIAKLEALNYKVVKPGEDPNNNPNKEEFFEEKQVIERNTGFIKDAVDFIQKSDEEVVRLKIENETISRYKSEGRNINPDQLKLEVDNLLDEYTQSPAVLKSYAETLRSQVQNSALEKKREIDSVESKIQDAIKQKEVEIKKKTQNAFKDIRRSQFFGIDITDDDIRKAYKNLTTGEVAKKLEDDTRLAAEVALFQIKKDEFYSKLGGPTYGEGVRDTFKEILGDDVTKPSTQRVISKNTRGNSTDSSSRLEAWLPKSSSKKDDKTNGRSSNLFNGI